MCLAGSEREVREWEQGRVGGLDVRAVGHEDAHSVGDRLDVGAGAVDAQEMGGAA